MHSLYLPLPLLTKEGKKRGGLSEYFHPHDRMNVSSLPTRPMPFWSWSLPRSLQRGSNVHEDWGFRLIASIAGSLYNLRFGIWNQALLSVLTQY